MWLLWLITLLNGVANNKTFLDARINLGFPINVFDILMGLGVLFALFFRTSRRTPIDQTHPAFKWTMSLLLLGGFCGFVNVFTNGSLPREFLTIARNYFTVPMAVLMGYLLVPRQRSAQRFIAANIVAGLCTALMIVLFFRNQVDTHAAVHNIDLLRTINYISSYAGIGGLFLLATIAIGVRYMPTLPAIFLAMVMILGQFATLSRSEWLATILTLLSVFALIHWEKRMRRILITASLVPVLLLSLYGGVVAVSAMGGWNFGSRMTNRLLSLVPGYDTTKMKAWDTRIPGALHELWMWSGHPVLGCGFAAQWVEQRTAPAPYQGGFYHNAWTATLAGAGIFGFLGMLFTVGVPIVIGRRLVLDRFDLASTFVGTFGFVSGVFFFLYGGMTMSWDVERYAIPFGLICGIVLRCRAIQLTEKRLVAEEEWFLQQNPELLYEYQLQMSQGTAEPAYGNGY